MPDDLDRLILHNIQKMRYLEEAQSYTTTLLKYNIKEIYIKCKLEYVKNSAYFHEYVNIFEKNTTYYIKYIIHQITYIQENQKHFYDHPLLLNKIIYEKKIEPKIYEQTNNFIKAGGFISTKNTAIDITEGFTLVKDFGNLKLTDYPLFSYEDIAHKLQPLNIPKPPILIEELKGRQIGNWTIINVFNDEKKFGDIILCANFTLNID